MFNKKLKKIVWQLADNLDETIKQLERVSGRYYNTRKDVELLQEGELKDLQNMVSMSNAIKNAEIQAENNRQNISVLLDYLKIHFDLEKGQKVIKKNK